MTPAPSFSLNGEVVEAKNTASTQPRSIPVRQSMAAATAIVTLSSSK
jgi:hypothetical protein